MSQDTGDSHGIWQKEKRQPPQERRRRPAQDVYAAPADAPAQPEASHRKTS